VPAGIDQFACCDVNNRGVAVAGGKVFVGRLDGHLVALDAANGKELWKTQVVDYTQGSVITSPPVIVKNLVITGFGGGEYGARGYISAMDQNTGKEVWRFWTIPGPGEPGNDSWKGDSWKLGGGTVWGIGSYDPKLNLLFYGTSNPSPWGASVRGPDSGEYGQFTNLYSSTTLAIDADTGKLKWHYQSTPHDAWDYDGVNELVLTELTIDGKSTPVVLKADRNGFFYVLNRETGKLISAKPFVPINWATSVDMTTGRPVEVAEKRPKFKQRAKDICPNLLGGKNWQPMSFNPKTGLVYIPSLNLCMDMEGAEPAYQRGKFYLAFEFELGKGGPGGYLGELLAWDPVKQQKAWGNRDELPWLGGTMTTASGLTFHGDITGAFKALDARSGNTLWQFNTGSGISAAPITYELDGKQYVAILSGLGGDPSFYYSAPKGGMLWVFAIDGKVDEGDMYNAQVIEKMLPTLNQ
jgi:PQQ-dependent dehydrogenase (methanol/ethanol family)